MIERIRTIGTVLRGEEIHYTSGSTKDEVAFTAKIIAFDDTFRSDEADPIWGLAFTSRDITQIKNIGTVLGKTKNVRVKIKRVEEGGAL